MAPDLECNYQYAEVVFALFLAIILIFRWPLYEALYGRRCRSSVDWFKVDKSALVGPDSVHYAMEKVKLIRDRLKTTQSHQKFYVNVRRREQKF